MEAARPMTSCTEKPGTAATSTTDIRPSVIVPVLSKSTVSTWPDDSTASYPLKKMPDRAPRSDATTRAIGVARPSAHGQAMISTDSAALRASSAPAPASAQPASVTSAMAKTAGTK